MLLTVTLNAAVDKLYTVPGFALDCVHRPTEVRTFAGGKGINVARVYQTLGGNVQATGFLGGINGVKIRSSLREEGIRFNSVLVSQESRLCIAVIDPAAGTQTELNESGPEVTLEECATLLNLLRELLPGSDAVVLSGSIPPGTPPAIYRDIITLAQDEFGVNAILDASGEALKLGIGATPFLVKPNHHELTALEIVGDRWGGSAQALREKYALPLAMVTGGSRGAVLASAAGIWEAVPPPIDMVSAVGSGDALTAAFLWATAQNWSLPEALKLGVAAGAANAATYGSGFCSRELIFEVAARVSANKLG